MTLRLATLLSVALSLLAGAAGAAPPVWTVHGPRGVVLLFGSIHLLPKGLNWRPPALEDALARAGDLWFELPIDRATDETAARLINRLGRLTSGDSLWTHVTADQRARLEAAAAIVGLDARTLTPLRPWMAEIALELAADDRSGGLVSEGVESRIQDEAPSGARRHGLETVAQQVGFLAGSSPADQIASLDATARELIADDPTYDRTVRAWLEGDTAGLRRDDLAPLEAAAPAIYRRLIVERNRRWARILRRLARNPGVTVVVVGAGHLIGPDGVPALLRAEGLVVDGPAEGS